MTTHNDTMTGGCSGRVTLDKTPIIRANDIARQDYIGIIEVDESVFDLTLLHFEGDRYLVAGTTCNVGLLPEYARLVQDSVDSDLPEFVSDIEEIEAGGIPSGDLLAWHGSMTI